MVDNRPTARLGDVVFTEFSQPQLTPSGSANTVEHDILPESPNDDKSTVIQPMGRSAHTFSLRGTCYEDTVSDLQDMIGDEVELRHSLWSGTVLVKDVKPQSDGGRDENGWWYTYRIKLLEVS